MVQEWIKTSEKVPENNGEYIVTYVYWDSDDCGIASVKPSVANTRRA